MKTKKKASLLTILLCVLAGCLILVGGIGGTRAVLNTSATYHGTLMTPAFDVELVEIDGTKETHLGNNATLSKVSDGKVEIGKPAEEVLTVYNAGDADQYVRVTFYQYWTEGDKKKVDLDPSLITLVLGSDKDWIVDETASEEFPERTVVYYNKVLKAKQKAASPVLTAVTVSGDIKLLVKETTDTVDGVTTTTYIYKYNGLTMNLVVSVDAIQARHGQEAIEASWGTDNVTVDETADPQLSLD